jgi:hypothetical protein
MRFPAVLLNLALAAVGASALGQGMRADYERARTLTQRTEGKVFRAKVTPHWLPGGATFWYRNDLADGAHEFVLVDAAKGERTVVPEAPKSAPEAIAEVRLHPSRDGGEETTIAFVNRTRGDVHLFWIDSGGARKPYGVIKPEERHEQHTFGGHVWTVEDAGGKSLGVFEAAESGGEAVIDGSRKDTVSKEAKPAESKPDREWRAFIREHNVWLKHRDSGKRYSSRAMAIRRMPIASP